MDTWHTKRLSIFGWWFIKLSNAFVLPDSWMVWNSQPLWIVSLFIFSCNFIKGNHYIQSFIFGRLINSSLYTIPGSVPQGYEKITSGACILLSSFALSAILLTFSVDKLCASLLSLY